MPRPLPVRGKAGVRRFAVRSDVPINGHPDGRRPQLLAPSMHEQEVQRVQFKIRPDGPRVSVFHVIRLVRVSPSVGFAGETAFGGLTLENSSRTASTATRNIARFSARACRAKRNCRSYAMPRWPCCTGSQGDALSVEACSTTQSRFNRNSKIPPRPRPACETPRHRGP